jgi:peroxiredoxin
MLAPLKVAAELPHYDYFDRDLWWQLQTIEVETTNESFRFQTFDTHNKTDLILMIGETADPNNGDSLVIKALSTSSTVWYLDTPDALFLERSRTAMRNHMGEFMIDLMNYATDHFERVSIITYDVVSVPVLRGLRNWQSLASKSQKARLQHVGLLYPSLYINSPQAGMERSMFPIAFQTALPITIFQPEHGAQTNAVDEMINALRQGGSLVRIESIAEATDGIYKYRDISKMAEIFAKRWPQAEQAMRQLRQQVNYPIFTQTKIDWTPPVSHLISGLKPLATPLKMPEIILKSFDGKENRIPHDYPNKALLINFWATWCPHCVDEIPSMNRALELIGKDKFAMISISYKDSDAIMKEFLQKVSVNFPVLMDYDGIISKQWKVFAFPSSFLVDKQGWIRYSINAGAIWDDPELLSIMQMIVNE